MTTTTFKLKLEKTDQNDKKNWLTRKCRSLPPQNTEKANSLQKVISN